MISKEIRNEIKKKLSGNKEVEALVLAHDAKGLTEKIREAGFDVNEADITEYLVGMHEIGADELEAISGGGGCIIGCPVDKCYD